METKEIYVEGYTYYNEDNGYSVLETSENNRLLIVVGYVSEDLTGETLRIRGETVIHPSYGKQFKMTGYEVIEPTDEEGIRRYLASGVIKGIGAALTERLIEAFGADVLRIMEEEPERLAEVKGISLRMAQELGVRIEEKKQLRNAMMFLQQYGVSNKMAVKIYDYYGDDLFDAIRENPYCLASEIEGIGFRSADEIARRMGFSLRSEHRLRSGVLYLLQTNLQEGNTYLPISLLLSEAASLLEVDQTDIDEILSDLAMDKKILVRGDKVYEKKIYTAEQRCAALLLEHNWISDEDFPKDLLSDLGRDSIELDPLQEEAVRESIRHGVFILTGGPGTGKTTTLNTMIRVLLRAGRQLVLAAPTGRAAKRMSEATGYEAKTIHRLLEVKGGEDGNAGYFDRNEDNPIDADVVILDEVSMVDLFLFQALLRALPPEAHLILVGDPNQLPSVGPGQILGDILKSGLFKAVQLTTIFRQDEESNIVLSAHRIRSGEPFPLTNKNEDFVFLQRDNVRDIRENILTMITKVMPRHFSVKPEEIQVLTPVKKGALGTEEMNLVLQRYLNPPDEDKAEREFGDKLLRVGDKVPFPPLSSSYWQQLS